MDSHLVCLVLKPMNAEDEWVKSVKKISERLPWWHTG